MRQYVIKSLETHLFFGRIMKEHAFFLLAGFPASENGYRNKANWFREQFEAFLWSVVQISDGVIEESVLSSGEIVTEFTEMAERQTGKLSGIPVNIRITQAELRLRAGTVKQVNKYRVQQVRNLNEHALRLLNGLISFKEQILKAVGSCELYTTNYPLLIEHILREARLYRQILMELEKNGCISPKDLAETEKFWNRIMMEHAQFIRGLLDPDECVLIETADMFAGDYCRLLELAKKQDCRAMDEISRRTLETTVRYRDFKAAGTQGILDCNIRSIILPLLADHVLREANHYLRILQTGEN